MKKYTSKNTQKSKDSNTKDNYRSINRFWGNAARLEHTNIRNKNKGKKR